MFNIPPVVYTSTLLIAAKDLLGTFPRSKRVCIFKIPSSSISYTIDFDNGLKTKNSRTKNAA